MINQIPDSSKTTFQVVAIMPVYRDWVSASRLCGLLDEEFSRRPYLSARILLIDDGSADDLSGWEPFRPKSKLQVEILRLKTNLGHQRAICIGVCYVYENIRCDAVVVMDADGEDSPADAARLIDLVRETGVAHFARRRKRMDGVTFKVGYALFRFVHYFLTGTAVRVGNFSSLPASALGVLACMSELWNHYSGAVFRSGLRFDEIPMDRGRRFHGESRMNLVSLVAHGISGIATFYPVVATRILVYNLAALFTLFLVLAGVLATRLYSDRAIPGWATYTAGIIIVLAMQFAAISFSLVFSLLSSRTNMTFIPLKEYALFIRNVHVVVGSSQ